MIFLFIVILALLSGGKRQGVLGCGLVGFCGEKPPDLTFIKILGIMNDERGGDACGILVDDNVHKNSTYYDRLFKDFFTSTAIEAPKNNFTIIGHARRASVGGKDKAHTHPFRWDYPKKNKSVIFAHNGTITNWKELKKEYMLGSHKSLDMDSKVLGKILSLGNTQVLGEYTGGAAILMTDLKEPNSLWAFKGGTKEYDDDTTYDVDRPLFYLETPEGIYLSSIKSSLEIYGGNSTKITEVPTNILLKMVGGKIVDEKKIDRSDISRMGISRSRPVNTPPRTAAWPINHGTRGLAQSGRHPLTEQERLDVMYGYGGSAMDEQDYARNNCGILLPLNATNSKKGKSFSCEMPDLEDFSLLGLPAPENDELKKFIKGKVYFARGRYWRNGHLCKGPRALLDNGATPDSISRANQQHEKTWYFLNGIKLDGNITESEYKELVTAYVSVKKNKGIDADTASFHLRNIISKYAAQPFEITPWDHSSIKENRVRRGLIYMDKTNVCVTGEFRASFARETEYKIDGGKVVSFSLSIPGRAKRTYSKPASSKASFVGSDSIKNAIHKILTMTDEEIQKKRWDTINFKAINALVASAFGKRLAKYAESHPTFWEEDFPFHKLEYLEMRSQIKNFFENKFCALPRSYFEQMDPQDLPWRNMTQGMINKANTEYAAISIVNNNGAPRKKIRTNEELIDRIKHMQSLGNEYWEQYNFKQVAWNHLDEVRKKLLQEKCRQFDPDEAIRLGILEVSKDGDLVRTLLALGYKKEVIAKMNGIFADIIFEGMYPPGAVEFPGSMLAIYPTKLPTNHSQFDMDAPPMRYTSTGKLYVRLNTVKGSEDSDQAEKICDKEVDDIMSALMFTFSTNIESLEAMIKTDHRDKVLNRLKTALSYLDNKPNTSWGQNL